MPGSYRAVGTLTFRFLELIENCFRTHAECGYFEIRLGQGLQQKVLASEQLPIDRKSRQDFANGGKHVGKFIEIFVEPARNLSNTIN